MGILSAGKSGMEPFHPWQYTLCDEWLAWPVIFLSCQMSQKTEYHRKVIGKLSPAGGETAPLKLLL